jgi:hypothetical protein
LIVERHESEIEKGRMDYQFQDDEKKVKRQQQEAERQKLNDSQPPRKILQRGEEPQGHRGGRGDG